MVRKRKEQERGRRDADRNGRGARKDDGPNYRRKKKERDRRVGGRIKKSKYDIHDGNIAKEKLAKYLEGRKSTGEIQTRKGDQSEGILKEEG